MMSLSSLCSGSCRCSRGALQMHALTESGNEALDVARRAERSVTEWAGRIAELDESAAGLRVASPQLEEATRPLADFLDGDDVDPALLQAVEDRLGLLEREWGRSRRSRRSRGDRSIRASPPRPERAARSWPSTRPGAPPGAPPPSSPARGTRSRPAGAPVDVLRQEETELGAGVSTTGRGRAALAGATRADGRQRSLRSREAPELGRAAGTDLCGRRPALSEVRWTPAPRRDRHRPDRCTEDPPPLHLLLGACAPSPQSSRPRDPNRRCVSPDSGPPAVSAVADVPQAGAGSESWCE